MNEYGILTFQSTHHAMKAEKALEGEGIKTKTIPTPRDITLSCGLAIRIGVDDLDRIQSLARDSKIDYKELYHLVIEDGKRRLNKLD